MIGIVSYGSYIPKRRISIEEISHAWGKNPRDIKHSLRIEEKAVAAQNEDALTMAYESAHHALTQADMAPTDIDVVLFGSETPPYSVNPTSTILAEWLGLGTDYISYDTEFACKAGTSALLSAVAHVESGRVRYGLVCAADKANARPNDPLEYTAGAGANAWLVGKKNVLASIEDSLSYNSDTPDFWRRAGQAYPSHAGRFTGKPAYITHIQGASTRILQRNKKKPTDFTYAVFHMPNGKFPVDVGLSLGFTKEQMEPSLIVRAVGNSYAASALMGLAAVLDQAQPGDSIFFASYGSGAGSDAMLLTVTDHIRTWRKRQQQTIQTMIEKKQYISYTAYMHCMGIV